jgi:hypothetical protein
MSVDDGRGTALFRPWPSLPSVAVCNQNDGTVSVVPPGGRLATVLPCPGRSRTDGTVDITALNTLNSQ